MTNEKNTRDMIVETHRDVKWICKSIAEIKESVKIHDERLRAVEDGRAGSHGREGKIAAGLGAGAGGAVAVILKMFEFL